MSIKADTRKLLIAFVVLVIAVCSICLTATSNRNIYHSDEVSSYVLATQPCQLDANGILGIPFRPGWNSAEDLAALLKPAEGHYFDYMMVISNQANDVHPPLFYLLLHTAISLFPDASFLYCGVLLNLLYYAIAVIFFYKICLELTHNANKSFLFVAVWSLSAGTIGLICFVRMYMLLCMLILIVIYILLQILKTGISTKYLVSLVLVSTAGFLTQYYFYIYMFFLTLASVIYLFCNRKRQDAITTGSAVLISVIIAVLLFPATIQHVISSPRGISAMSATSNNASILSRLGCGITLFIQDFAGFMQYDKLRSAFSIIGGIVIILLIAVIAYLRHKYNSKTIISFGLKKIATNYGYTIIGVATLLSFVVVIAISPTDARFFFDRYYLWFSPLMCLLLYGIIDYESQHWCSIFGASARVKNIILLGILVCLCVCSNIIPTNMYIWRVDDDYDIVSVIENKNVIYVMNSREAFMADLSPYCEKCSCNLFTFYYDGQKSIKWLENYVQTADLSNTILLFDNSDYEDALDIQVLNSSVYTLNKFCTVYKNTYKVTMDAYTFVLE